MQAMPLILSIAGPVLKGAAGYGAGQQNAAALEAQANEEALAGAQTELRIRDSARKAIGEQLAAQGSNGFLGGTGSALEALTESQVNAALDAMLVRRDAAMKSSALREQAGMQRRQAKLSVVEGLIGAGSAYLATKADWAAVKPPPVSSVKAKAGAGAGAIGTTLNYGARGGPQAPLGSIGNTLNTRRMGG